MKSLSTSELGSRYYFQIEFRVSSWTFLLFVVIWYDVIFQTNKTSKLLQTKGVSLDVLKLEMRATRKFFLGVPRPWVS